MLHDSQKKSLEFIQEIVCTPIDGNHTRDTISNGQAFFNMRISALNSNLLSLEKAIGLASLRAVLLRIYGVAAVSSGGYAQLKHAL